MSKKCAERLTDLEVHVMKVLWDSERAMTNSEIAEKLKEETNLSVASVAQLVKRLLQKNNKSECGFCGTACKTSSSEKCVGSVRTCAGCKCICKNFQT